MANPKHPNYPRPETNRASGIWRRNDALRHEQDGRDKPNNDDQHIRPWFVLSDRATHNRDLLIGAVMSSSMRLDRDDLSVTNYRKKTDNYPSFVDVQQTWTFSMKRHAGINRKAIILPSTPGLVRQELLEHFGTMPINRDASEFRQGQVVGIRLHPRPERPTNKPKEYQMPSKTADLQEWIERRADALRLADVDEFHDILTQIGARRVEEPRAWFLPAIVITSNRFLRSKVSLSRDGLLPLVTVVPLVRDEGLLATENTPRVTPAPEHGTAYAAITQAVLTLDSGAVTLDGRKRMVPRLPDMPVWQAARGEFQTILNEVMDFMLIHDGGKP